MALELWNSRRLTCESRFVVPRPLAAPMMEIWQHTIKWKMWQINQTFTSKISKSQFEPLQGPKIAQNNKNSKIPSAWGPIFGPRVEIWPKFIKYGCWAIKRWITLILTKSLLGPLRKPQIGFKMNSAARENWVQLHGAGCGTLQCEWISNIYVNNGVTRGIGVKNHK